MNIKFSEPLVRETSRSSLDYCGTVTFIRHGQSEYNRADFEFRKRNPFRDAPLSDIGVQQALDLRAALSERSFDRILVSPLTRALQTAKLCLSAHHPKIEVCAACCEWMIAPTDVPSSEEDVRAVLAFSQTAKADEGTASMFGPISRSKERDILRQIHRSWFKRMGLTEERPEGFAARVEALRNIIALETSGELLVIGHARLFKALVSGDVFRNCEVRKLHRKRPACLPCR